MISNLHFGLSGEPPVPSPNADFEIKIDFKKGEGNPRRVFDAASLLIAGFELLDEAAAATIDAKVEPFLVLEDVRASSIRIFLKNLLVAVDDQALKELDWKPAVGKYLVRAKYASLRWLDSHGDDGPPSLQNLVDELRQIATETDVRHLPDYPPIHEARLVGALEKLQDAKRQLSKSDRLYIETEDETYEVNLTRTWSPSQEIAPDAQRETITYGEMILTVRKPDMIGASQWQFRHGKQNLNAPIHDEEWMARYHDRLVDIRPGDALRCWVRFVYEYDPKGSLVGQRLEIEKVFEVIPGPAGEGQGSLSIIDPDG